MSRTRQSSMRNVDKMMLGSGTNSHLTSLQQKVSTSKLTDVPITLDDDSKINGTAEGIRDEDRKTDDGYASIKVWKKIFILNLSMDLRLIASIVNKKIAVLLMP